MYPTLASSHAKLVSSVASLLEQVFREELDHWRSSLGTPSKQTGLLDTE